MSIKIKEFMLDFIEETNKDLLENWLQEKKKETDKEIIESFFELLNHDDANFCRHLISLCETAWRTNIWEVINWNEYKVVKTIWWHENCWTTDITIFERKEKWTWDLSYFLLYWDYNSWSWTVYKYVNECTIEEFENYSYNEYIYY